MLRFTVFGAGRIGQVHAGNIAAHPQAELAYVVDIEAEAARALAGRYGASVASPESAVADSDVVIIGSPTPTHVELIELALRHRRPIFCEKPVDLNLARVDQVLAELDRAGVPMLVGFNRRFDPSFSRLKQELAEGRIGTLEMINITSRDPSPPPPDYVRASGGLFRDMMIHDFDMARWLLGQDPVEVYATASNLVDPSIGEAQDVDTAVVVMKTASGALVQISNSRRAVYGYDQRVEAFGSEGMLLAQNQPITSVLHFGAEGVVAEKPQPFFLERYAAAYRAELDHFVQAVLSGDPVFLAGPRDGRQALALAEAALASVSRNRPVEL